MFLLTKLILTYFSIGLLLLGSLESKEIYHTFRVNPNPSNELKKILQRSRELLSKGEGVMLVLKTGTYSAELDLTDWEKPADTPFIIRAEKSGSVLWYSSARRIKGWRAVNDNIWEKEKIDFSPDSQLIVGRKTLQRVKGLSVELEHGEYRYNSSNKTLQIRLKSLMVEEPEVWLGEELSSKPMILADGFSYLALRGISFVGNQAQPGAVWIRRGRGIEITQCSFLYSRGVGLLLEGLQKVSLSSLNASKNTLEGFLLRDTQIVQAISLTAENNGAEGVVIDHGGEMFFSFLRLVDNHQTGLKIRSLGGSVSLENPFVARNRGDGIEVKGSRGLVTIDGGEIAMNQGTGIRLDTAMSNIQYSIIVGNGRPGIGKEPLGQLVLEENKQPPKDHQWEQNIVMGLEPGVPLIDLPFSKKALDSLQNDQNLYFQKSLDYPFRILHLGLTWEEYRILTGTDLRSAYGDPKFYDLMKYDYQLLPESPFINKENWAAFIPNKDRKSAFMTLKDRLFDHSSPHPLYKEDPQPQWLPLTLEKSWIDGTQPLHLFPIAPALSNQNYRQIPFSQLALTLPNRSARERFPKEVFSPDWGTEESGKVEVLAFLTNKKNHYFKDLFLLASLDGEGTFSEKAEVKFLYSNGDSIGQIIRTPGQAIPWESKTFYDHLNQCHLQERTSKAFHFSGLSTQPLAFWNSENHSATYYYLIRVPNPHPTKKVRSIALRSNALDNSIAVIHAITFRL